jgi:nicotinamide riboside transporter PnuC
MLMNMLDEKVIFFVVVVVMVMVMVMVIMMMMNDGDDDDDYVFDVDLRVVKINPQLWLHYDDDWFLVEMKDVLMVVNHLSFGPALDVYVH